MQVSGERIPVPGTYNFRDVGGYPVPGGSVRSGKLFRSDALSRLGDEGRNYLGHLGVGTVVDLRDNDEVELFPDDLAGLEVQLVRLPVFEGSGRSQAVSDSTLRGLYEAILLHHKDALISALRYIIAADQAVVIHCAAGKDRTGIVIALALSLIGVSREAVISDYARTQPNLEGEWVATMTGLAEKHGFEVTPRLMEIMAGSPPEAMAGLLDLINERFGDVVGFVNSAGLSEREIDKLRASLVMYD